MLFELPKEDGPGYRVEEEDAPFVGYLYEGLNGKLAIYSIFGQAMTDNIFDTPEQAVLYIKKGDWND